MRDEVTATSHEPARGARRDSHGIFFVGMAVLLTALVFAAFAPTFYMKSLFSFRDLTNLEHIHGVVGTAWLLLFFAQTVLYLTTTGRPPQEARVSHARTCRRNGRADHGSHDPNCPHPQRYWDYRAWVRDRYGAPVLGKCEYPDWVLDLCWAWLPLPTPTGATQTVHAFGHAELDANSTWTDRAFRLLGPPCTCGHGSPFSFDAPIDHCVRRPH